MEEHTLTGHCQLCGADAKWIRTVSSGFRVLRCQRCRFSWVWPPDLDRPEAQPIYDDYGYNHAIAASFPVMRNTYRGGLTLRLTRSGLTHPKGLKFLDVGCANGEYLQTALDLGFSEVAGVEIDVAARAKASRLGPVVTDAKELQGQRFHVVQIKNVLTNIRDPLAFLETQLSLLEPGGLLFLDVLNQDSLTALLRNGLALLQGTADKLSPLRPPYVINGFSKGSLRQLGEHFGLASLLIETSHLGGPHVPYSPALLVKRVGQVGTAIGRGSMLIADFRKAT